MTVAGKAYIVKDCPLKFCRLHVKYSPVIWRTAREKADKLDYRKGELPGLYPYKWEVREQWAIEYHYDEITSSGWIGFFNSDASGPDLVPQVVHIGIYPFGRVGTTKDIKENEYFLLHRVFRAELLGIKMKYVVETNV